MIDDKEKLKIILMLRNLERMFDETYTVNRKGFRDRADVILGFLILKEEIGKM